MAISDLFFRGRADRDAAHDTPGPQHAGTKALSRFLATLGALEQPVLVDLGPAVGSNVTFFGERLGCRTVIEDLFTDIDRHVREDRVADLPRFFEQRFPHEDDSVDGILCWDVFDYLSSDAAVTLAERLTRMLRPCGVLLAFFNTTEPAPDAFRYTKHLVIDQGTLERRPYEAACGKRRPVLSREVESMFTPLRVAEQFLLKSQIREVLFKKLDERIGAGSALSVVDR